MLCLVGMTPFVILEYCTVRAYGLGWLSAWNVLDTSTYALQVSHGAGES